MKASFEARGKQYDLDIEKVETSEGEKFAMYEAVARRGEEKEIKGTLKLTAKALELAAERAAQEGGTAEDWVSIGCARSLAAECLIRELKPEFSFVVDHRWVEGH